MTERDYTTDELLEALRPIASLIAKSEKSIQKVMPQTWQHSMLKESIAAWRVGSVLMQEKTEDANNVLRASVEESLAPIASMINKTEKALEKFSPGTAQHSLLRNRLSALRMAGDLLARRLNQRVLKQ